MTLWLVAVPSDSGRLASALSFVHIASHTPGHSHARPQARPHAIPHTYTEIYSAPHGNPCVSARSYACVCVLVCKFVKVAENVSSVSLSKKAFL